MILLIIRFNLSYYLLISYVVFKIYFLKLLRKDYFIKLRFYINYVMLQQVQKVFTFTPEQRKQEVILKRKDNVFYLFLNRKANSFTHDFVRLISKKIDQVTAHDGPTALVTISLSKFFSGGLDLKYSSNLPYESQGWFVLQFISLLGKIALLPFPTIALVKGAALAGGCMLAFAHDFIYAADSALFACNQVDIGLPLPPGMFAIIKRKHSNHKTLRDMCLFGKKFSGQECLKEGIIDGISSSKTILKEIQQKAKHLSNYGENKQNFKKLKQQAYKQIIDGCFNRQHAVGMVGEMKFPLLPKL